MQQDNQSALIGANFSDYKGDPYLGGANGEAIKIDPKPLDNLVAYVNLQNKTFWEQKQKNADKLVTALASTSNLDVNYLYGKDRNEMIEQQAGLAKEISNTLRKVPSDPTEYAKWYADAQAKIGQVAASYTTKKERTVDRAAQIDAINQKYTNDPAARTEAMKELDDNFNKTNGKLTPIDLWTPVAIPAQKSASVTVDAYHAGKGNMDIKSALTMWDVNGADNQASQLSVFGTNLNGQYPPETIVGADGKTVTNPAYSEWAKGKSEKEISFAKIQNLHPEETKQALGQGASELSEVIGKYYGEDGNFNESAFLASGNKLAIDNYNSVKKMTAYATLHKAAMLPGGTLTDQGIGYRLPSTMNASDWDKAIVTDYRNITPKQLLMAHNLEISGADKITNEEIKTNADENAKNRANENYNKALDRGGGGSGSGGADGSITTPAILFAKHVNDAKDYFAKVEANGGKMAWFDVKIGGVDKNTQEAMGIKDATQVQNVRYFPNGDYQIFYKPQDDPSLNIPPQRGTIEQLRKGFIDNVKGGNSMDSKFQEKAEQPFGGYTGTQIWDNWNGKNAKAATVEDKQPKELKGKVDPSQLQNGQSYIVNGVTYVWDGKNLNQK